LFYVFNRYLHLIITPPRAVAYRKRIPRASSYRGADAALPDVLLALASCERRADFSRPCGARFTDLAART
jgi:hypothetical protein